MTPQDSNSLESPREVSLDDLRSEPPGGPAFHVYELREGGKPFPVASCDGDSLAFTLLTLDEEQQLTGPVGILYRPEGEEKGKWLVSPWKKGA